MENKKRRYKIIIEIEPDTIDKGRDELEATIKALDYKVIEVKHVTEFISDRQRKSLHLWFTQIAIALNEKHVDMRAFLSADVEMPWTGYAIKEYIFKPLIFQLFGKKSTNEIYKSKELDILYDILNREIIKRTKGEVNTPPWPCQELKELEAINKLN